MAELTIAASVRAVLEHALRSGVAFVPGEEFHLAGGLKSLRLNFSNSPPGVIHEGVRRLRRALEQAGRMAAVTNGNDVD